MSDNLNWPKSVYKYDNEPVQPAGLSGASIEWSRKLNPGPGNFRGEAETENCSSSFRIKKQKFWKSGIRAIIKV